MNIIWDISFFEQNKTIEEILELGFTVDYIHNGGLTPLYFLNNNIYNYDQIVNSLGFTNKTFAYKHIEDVNVKLTLGINYHWSTYYQWYDSRLL